MERRHPQLILAQWTKEHFDKKVLETSQHVPMDQPVDAVAESNMINLRRAARLFGEKELNHRVLEMHDAKCHLSRLNEVRYRAFTITKLKPTSIESLLPEQPEQGCGGPRGAGWPQGHCFVLETRD